MGYSAPSLILFEEVFYPTKKNYYQEFLIAKIRNFPYEHLFFSEQATAKVPFFLDLRYTRNNTHRVWSNFKKFLILWNRKLLLKIIICKICNFPYENLTFFPWQAIAKFIFVSDFYYTWDTLRRVWSYLTKFLTTWKKKTIIKNCYSQSSQFSVWTPIFSLANSSNSSFSFKL